MSGFSDDLVHFLGSRAEIIVGIVGTTEVEFGHLAAPTLRFLLIRATKEEGCLVEQLDLLVDLLLQRTSHFTNPTFAVVQTLLRRRRRNFFSDCAGSAVLLAGSLCQRVRRSKATFLKVFADMHFSASTSALWFLSLALGPISSYSSSSSAASSSSTTATPGLSFALLGDWGTPSVQQSAVLQSLASSFDSSSPFDFVLSLGDENFSYHKVGADVTSAPAAADAAPARPDDDGSSSSSSSSSEHSQHSWSSPPSSSSLFVLYFSTCDGREVRDRSSAYKSGECPSGLVALVVVQNVDVRLLVRPCESLSSFEDDDDDDKDAQQQQQQQQQQTKKVDDEYFSLTETTIKTINEHIDIDVSWLFVVEGGGGHYTPVYKAARHDDDDDGGGGAGNGGGVEEGLPPPPCGLVSPPSSRLLPMLRENGVDAYYASGREHALAILRSGSEDGKEEDEVTLISGATTANAGIMKPGFVSVEIEGCEIKLSVVAFDVDDDGSNVIVGDKDKAVVYSRTQRAERRDRFGCEEGAVEEQEGEREEEKKEKKEKKDEKKKKGKEKEKKKKHHKKDKKDDKSDGDLVIVIFICFVGLACMAFVFKALSRLDDKAFRCWARLGRSRRNDDGVSRGSFALTSDTNPMLSDGWEYQPPSAL